MNTTGITRRIGLIGCSASKNPAAVLDQNLLKPAKDMYIGGNFLKSRDEGIKHFDCEDYYILSGKYGLLDKDDMIQYYNCYLHDQSSEYKKAWSEKVYNQLKEKFGDELKNIEFIFFCGQDYSMKLKKRLNCKTLKIVAYRITFDIKEERVLVGEKSQVVN